jgi:hypothetical protein
MSLGCWDEFVEDAVVRQKPERAASRILDGHWSFRSDRQFQHQHIRAQAQAQTLPADPGRRRVQHGNGGYPVIRTADIEVTDQPVRRANQAGNLAPDIGVWLNKSRQHPPRIVGQSHVVAEQEHGAVKESGQRPLASGQRQASLDGGKSCRVGHRHHGRNGKTAQFDGGAQRHKPAEVVQCADAAEVVVAAEGGLVCSVNKSQKRTDLATRSVEAVELRQEMPAVRAEERLRAAPTVT